MLTATLATCWLYCWAAADWVDWAGDWAGSWWLVLVLVLLLPGAAGADLRLLE